MQLTTYDHLSARVKAKVKHSEHMLYGDRAVSVAGPVVWNSLPAAVREADSLHSFRRKLKTHLFTLCFND